MEYGNHNNPKGMKMKVSFGGGPSEGRGDMSEKDPGEEKDMMWKALMPIKEALEKGDRDEALMLVSKSLESYGYKDEGKKDMPEEGMSMEEKMMKAMS